MMPKYSVDATAHLDNEYSCIPLRVYKGIIFQNHSKVTQSMTDENQKLDLVELEYFFKDAVSSTNHFPFDFDQVWLLIGYCTKGNAKTAFENAGLVRDIDFQVFMESQKNPKGGRPLEKIRYQPLLA